MRWDDQEKSGRRSPRGGTADFEAEELGARHRRRGTEEVALERHTCGLVSFDGGGSLYESWKPRRSKALRRPVIAWQRALSLCPDEI